MYGTRRSEYVWGGGSVKSYVNGVLDVLRHAPPNGGQ